MKTKIWKKHIFGEILKTQIFFIAICFVIYGLMNFSFQSRHILSKEHINLIKVFQFYAQSFILQFDIFLPLTFLLAFIKVICAMNANNELVALQMAGLSMKDLLKPIFLLASIITAITLINTEWVIPASIQSNIDIKAKHIRSPKSNKKTKFVNVKLLTDDSKIIFLTETAPNEFFDVYWMRSSDELWHIKQLSILPGAKIGKWVDHFVKDKDLGFQKVDSFETYSFTQMADEIKDRINSPIPTENKSITLLSKQLFFSQYSSAREKAETITYLYYKLAMSLLPFLIILAISPFCFRFSRNIPTFIIFGLSLLGFIVFFTVMDAMIIIAENLVLPAYIAIWLPFVLAYFFFGMNFLKNLYSVR